MVGIATIIFVRSSIKEKITRVNYDLVKLGTMGTTGNKGAVAIRFNFYDSSFVFTNCHLAAGK
jgi:synaptojanin